MSEANPNNADANVTLLGNPGLIRNRLKITSVRDNARAALAAIAVWGVVGVRWGAQHQLAIACLLKVL